MAGGVWGYKPNAKVKTRDETIRLLVSVVGRDGTFFSMSVHAPMARSIRSRPRFCGMLATG